MNGLTDALLHAGFSPQRLAIGLTVLACVACLDIVSRTAGRKSHFAFGAVLGGVLGWGIVTSGSVLLNPEVHQSGYVLAMGVIFLVVLWRFLFGTWEAHTKATVLGAFLLWIIIHVIAKEDPTARIAHFIAIAVAILPVMAWCAVFLPYHRERLSVVLCMFFAGMLSTIPILFYDALVRRGIALDFFLFKIETQSFSVSAHAFVGEAWPALSVVGSSVLSAFVSFLVVGMIEEGSKMWVLRKAGGQFFTSIDDTMQLAILVALGFAFAENVTATGYFVSFVREYILGPSGPDWIGFIGNVTGRSILTTMVHIVSTGVVGYFLGLAIFAGPLLKEEQAQGRKRQVLEYFHRMFGMKTEAIFRREMLIIGFFLAAFLHGFCNFLVTLPDLLPGNPRTLGDLLGSPEGSPFHMVALLLVPTLIYVVGGFAVLTMLFNRKENRKERGHLIPSEMFVTGEVPL